MTDKKTLDLKMVLGNWGHTDALKDGRVTIEGVNPEFVKVEPMIAAYRRMIRDLEFDACEIACTTYFIARSFGYRLKALPIFLNRKFHHAGIVCRTDAGIIGPKDLEGKSVGVRAYSVTTGVWTRGILADEYGLDLSKVNWVVDDEEHVPELMLPSNVQHVPEGESLVSMMAEGKIQAGFTSRAGIGRSGPPTADWEGKGAQVEQNYVDLIDNTAAIEAEWYKKTSVYPQHGVLVVKEQLLEDNPWLARSLYDAFKEAKEKYLIDLNSGAANSKTDLRLKKQMEVVGADPLPYGVEANLPSINKLAEYAYAQGLMPKKMTADDLFVRIDD